MESLLCVLCSKETVHMPSDWSVGKPIVKIEFTNCEESKQNHLLNRPSISPVTKVIQWAIIFTVRPATRSGSDVFVLPRHFIRFLRLKGNVQKLTGWNKKKTLTLIRDLRRNVIPLVLFFFLHRRIDSFLDVCLSSSVIQSISLQS